jgi:hypothetical protein
MPDAEAGPVETPVAGPEAPAPVAAPGWLDRAPVEPWCPAALESAIPWGRDFRYADAASRLASGPAGWSLLGGTRRGRLHAHRGEFREDAFGLHAGDRCFVLAAADGAGSCRLSRIGAELTCRTAVRALATALQAPSAGIPEPGGWLGAAAANAVTAAVEALTALANGAGIAAKEFRTTGLVAVWWDSPLGPLLACAQVGDGFIAVRRADGRVERAGAGDVSEFSGEVSCFIPDSGASERARAGVVLDATDITAVILATDGVEDPFYPVERTGPLLLSQLADGVTSSAPHFQRQELHGPVFGPDGERELLRWLAFERRGENDDRTLVAAWR